VAARAAVHSPALAPRAHSLHSNRRLRHLRCCEMQVEKELSDICSSILSLLDDHLIPTASSGESKVFYLKVGSCSPYSVPV